jgi:hypothetical protein
MSQVMSSSDGRHWEPAVPLPLYAGRPWRRRFICGCGHAAKSEQEYEAHYKAEHLNDQAQV